MGQTKLVEGLRNLGHLHSIDCRMEALKRGQLGEEVGQIGHQVLHTGAAINERCCVSAARHAGLEQIRTPRTALVF